VLGHAPSGSYKREFATAADHIGGRPQQDQYSSNPAIRPKPGVGWAYLGRFK